MENALLVGLSRQMALTHQLDIVANNIANLNTSGFKADNALFAQYLMPQASDQSFTGQDRRVTYVEDRASWIDMSPGAVQHTGDPLDVAIDGNAYFVVQTPNGQQRYTRNGSFAINGTGQLVTSEGYQVVGDSGPITFQSTDHDVVISPTGMITVREGTNTNDSARGQLQLVSFANPAAIAEVRRLDIHGARQCHAQSRACRHQRRAGRDREIKRQRRRRNGAPDRD